MQREEYIAFCQIKIFNLVVNNEFIARNLVRKLDDEGNSFIWLGKKEQIMFLKRYKALHFNCKRS